MPIPLPNESTSAAGRRGDPLSRLLLAVHLAACLLSQSAAALDPARPLARFVKDVWQPEQGLPNSNVNALLQTRDGYLWVGTRDGLARFDGVRFTVFDRTNTPGLAAITDYVQSLAEDAEGTLWIGTSGGIARYRGGTLAPLPAAGGLASRNVSDLLVDRSGTLWAGTRGGGLGRLGKDGVFHAIPTAAGAPLAQVAAIAEDGDGRLWVAASPDPGLYEVRDGVLVRFVPSSGPLDEPVTTLLRGRDGRLRVATTTSDPSSPGIRRPALFRLDGNRLFPRTLPASLESAVNALLEDRNGSTWVATGSSGIARLREGASGADDSALPGTVVTGFCEDREGSLWIATYSGLQRMRDTPFVALTTRDGLPEGVVKSISAGRDGGVWIGTLGGGLFRHEGGRLRSYTTRDGLLSNLVRCTLEDDDGSLWVGTDVGICRLARGAVVQVITTGHGLSHHRINALAKGPDGSLWASTDGGLNRIRGGAVQSYTRKDGLPDDQVGALLVDGDVLWIGTYGSGLGRYAGGRFTTLTTADGLSSDKISSLLLDGDGSLWIGTFSGGIDRLHRGRVTAVTRKQGLPENVVLQLLDDGVGNLWASTSRGVFRVRKADLVAVGEGTRRSVEGSWYGTADGMPSAQCTGGSQPAGCRAADGTLWFPTARGVAVLDPSKLHPNPVAPNVVVEEVVVDGETVDLHRPVALAPGKRNFQFRYTAPSFVSPEKVRFRYRLEGWDEGWVEAGSRRTAWYTNVPRGRHVFRVTACNEDGVWSEAGASVPFLLPPRLHETWWFRGLALAGLLAAGFGAHRARTWRLEARQAELQGLVDEKTRSVVEANEQLEQANALLEEAQAKLASLVRSSPRAVEDVARWAAETATEIARTIEVDSVDVWVFENGALSSVSGASLPAPTLSQLKKSADSLERPLERDRQTLMPITGASGTLLGALAISPKPAPWAISEERLVGAFAHQLASTLELRSVQQELSLASEKRRVTREQLLEEGVELLHLCTACSECFPHTVERCPNDGTELQSPPGFLPFRLAGRYRLRSVLADGGMGTVFTALDERLGREVAVKVIKLGRFSDASTKLRFEHEAHAVAQIDHPGVIVVHDLGEVDGGATFLVMELLEGLDLLQLVAEQGRGTPRQVALLLRQVSSALAAAHRRNIVHRDVKPENIVLVPKGGSFQAKVLDFGLAKTPDQGHLTHSGMIVGTPRYMSPEQAQSGLVDRRSDLYSLACVAFFALTGEHVVTATEVVDVLMEVVRGEPRPPSELVPGLPGEVDRLFQAALAKDPRRRPADLEAWAGRLADELEASLGTCTGWDVPRLARVRTPEPGSAGDGDETAVSPVARLGKLRAAEPPPSS